MNYPSAHRASNSKLPLPLTPTLTLTLILPLILTLTLTLTRCAQGLALARLIFNRDRGEDVAI
eukprot:scaffold22305_cov54-Phaeocystis_antarctica.AAC.2